MSDYFPSMGWVDKITGAVRRLEKNVNKFDNLIENVIQEHLDPTSKRSDYEDVVDVLLRLQQDASHLTRDDIKGVLMDIFIAGTETTSATLVWAMSELIRNPRVIKNAQDEVRGVVGSKDRVEEGDLHNLRYLKSVVKETLRLRSPVPLLLPRETISHCKIGGYDVLPNTRVFINGWGLGRDPKLWEDPEEFLPERFMDGSVDFKGHDFHFIPFGSGRRICPAMNLGIATIELALANLLYCFEWELPPGMSKDEIDMNEAIGVTVHKKCALLLVAKKYDMN